MLKIFSKNGIEKSLFLDVLHNFAIFASFNINFDLELKYDYLFVGSDYRGSEKFDRYETFFRDKDVKIIYLPYTKETNSTQLRNMINLQTH